MFDPGTTKLAAARIIVIIVLICTLMITFGILAFQSLQADIDRAELALKSGYETHQVQNAINLATTRAILTDVPKSIPPNIKGKY